MWRLLRESFPNHHFRRQVPIRHFIADFASHRAKLVIEVDGGQHGTPKDAVRTKTIEEGYRVIRFWNNDVLGNPGGVWTLINAALLAQQDPRALPFVEGGLGAVEPEAPFYADNHPTPAPPHQGEGK